MVATLPVWRDAQRLGRASSEIPARVDVAVVGGGIIGLTAMHHLVRAGTNAVLVDAGQPGAGSSTTGSGVVGWSRTTADPTEIDPRASGFAALAQTVAGAQGWFARFVADHRLEAGLQIPGSVHLAGPLDPGELGTVHPGRLIDALVTSIIAMGGALAVDEPLRSASRHTAGFQLLTSRRKISAEAVILAAGAAPGPYPMGDLRRRYRHRRGRCLAVRHGAAELDAVAHHGGSRYTPSREISTVRRMTDTSALVWFPDLGRRRRGRNAADLVTSGWPGLSGCEITHDWPDDYATTHDGLPRIGRSNGIWYAGGAADPALGALVGDHAAGLTIGTVGSSPFAEIPHDYALTTRLRRARGAWR